MESNRKRRGGFIKAKIVAGLPFYKPAKNASTGQYNNTKLTPSQQASKSTASVGLMVHQEYVPNPKVSFIVPEKNGDAFSKFDKVFTYPCEVDLKASNYISSVQERFKLEQINSEHAKCHEIANP